MPIEQVVAYRTAKLPDDVMGMYDGSITINENLGIDDMRTTLFHELLHELNIIPSNY